MLIFFFKDPATTEIYTLPLHDALPISTDPSVTAVAVPEPETVPSKNPASVVVRPGPAREPPKAAKLTSIRSEEHTSELQSRQYLVCRLLLEKKKHIF